VNSAEIVESCVAEITVAMLMSPARRANSFETLRGLRGFARSNSSPASRVCGGSRYLRRSSTDLQFWLSRLLCSDSGPIYT
jgi:hypothetical protein